MRNVISIVALMLVAAYAGSRFRADAEPQAVAAQSAPIDYDQPPASEPDYTLPEPPVVIEPTEPEPPPEWVADESPQSPPVASVVYQQPVYAPQQYAGRWVTQRSGAFGRQQRLVWVPARQITYYQQPRVLGRRVQYRSAAGCFGGR